MSEPDIRDRLVRWGALLSCLDDVEPADAVLPVRPQAVMRVGRVPVLPYAPPGSDGLGPLVRAAAARSAAVLPANHGPVVAGPSLDAAVYAAEQLEETAKLAVLGRGLPLRRLDPTKIADLQTRFPLR